MEKKALGPSSSGILQQMASHKAAIRKLETGLDMGLGCNPHAVPYISKGQQFSKIEPQ